MAYARKFLSDTHFNTNPSPPPPSLPSPLPNPPEVVAEETDFVIILAALLCALICVVGLLAVARCAWLRRGLSGGGGGGGAGGGSRIANKGLKKKVLNSLPKYTYSSDINKIQAAEVVEKSTTEKSTVVEVEDCAICLSEYVDGDEIRVLPQCGHRFHVQCIDTWLGSHSSCPSCRQILVQGRCRKCGEFPAGGSTGASGGYTFVKPSQAASCSTSPPTFLP